MPEYKPLYSWRVTWPDPFDADTHKTDFCGWDGDVCIGRIRLEDRTPKKGQWQWSGQGPIPIKHRLLPQQGFVETAREASRKVEEYYHALMRHNGLRGSRDKGEP